MAVVVVPEHEPQGLRNQTLREICARAGETLADERDRYLVEEASAMHSLDFNLIEPARRTRVARAVARAIEEYRSELLEVAEPDELISSRIPVLAGLGDYLSILLPDD